MWRILADLGSELTRSSLACGLHSHSAAYYFLSGMAGLQSELALDVQRMWLRNLGRDDRLVADQSREVSGGTP